MNEVRITEIGQLFSHRRKDKGLSQEALGQKIGVGRSQISKVESGKGLSFATIQKVAKALNSEVVVSLRPDVKPTKAVVEYIVAAVNEFARLYSIGVKEAYNYLLRFKGMAFLEEHYEAEHTLSFEDCMEDLAAICRKNGGQISQPAPEARFESSMTKSNFNFLVEGISADIARYIAEDEGATITEALGVLYNSTTFEKLSNPDTGLYLNSSAYVYELLKRELREGKWPSEGLSNLQEE